MSDFSAAVAGYRNRWLLIDTNLLLLYVVGTADRRIVQRHKRTRQFAPDDFDAETVRCINAG
jgi:hypothetical protein